MTIVISLPITMKADYDVQSYLIGSLLYNLDTNEKTAQVAQGDNTLNGSVVIPDVARLVNIILGKGF